MAFQILSTAFGALLRGFPSLLWAWLLPIVTIGVALGLFDLLTNHRPAPGLALWVQRLALLVTVYAGLAAVLWGALRQHISVVPIRPEPHRNRLYPRRIPCQIALYFGALLLIAFMLVLPGSVVLLLVTQLVLPWASGGEWAGWLAMLGVKTLALTGFLFFAPVLPAIAIGARLRLAGAASLCLDHLGSLLLLAALLVVLDQLLIWGLQLVPGLPRLWEGAALLRIWIMVAVSDALYRQLTLPAPGSGAG